MQTFESASREYVRRIGYTSGAYDLPRFGKVIELFAHQPTRSRVWLLKEVSTWKAGARGLSDKYARGILEIAESLQVIRHTGEVYALTWQGSVYLALLESERFEETQRLFFLRRVISADADYSLNILSLVASGLAKATLLEENFLQHVVRLLEDRRSDLTKLKEARRFEYRTVVEEAHRTASRSAGNVQAQSTDDSAKRRTDTARHHVLPRLGWLKYLDLATGSNESLKVTDAGERLLNWLRQRGWVRDTRIIVPPDASLMVDEDDGLRREDFLELSTAAYRPSAAEQRPDTAQLLNDVVALYDKLRNPSFNQASVDALGEALESLSLARDLKINGLDAIEMLLNEFPDHFSKLRAGGRVAYVSLRKLPISS